MIVAWLLVAVLFVLILWRREGRAPFAGSLVGDVRLRWLNCVQCGRAWIWRHRAGDTPPERCPECLLREAGPVLDELP